MFRQRQRALTKKKWNRVAQGILRIPLRQDIADDVNGWLPIPADRLHVGRHTRVYIRHGRTVTLWIFRRPGKWRKYLTDDGATGFCRNLVRDLVGFIWRRSFNPDVKTFQSISIYSEKTHTHNDTLCVRHMIFHSLSIHRSLYWISTEKTL